MGFQGVAKDKFTSTELSGHISDTDLHHARYTKEEVLEAAVQAGALESLQVTKAPTHDAVIAALNANAETQANKTTVILTIDSVVSAVTNAPTQTGSYVEADVQAIADLANDLKTKYNDAVTLINELKAKLDTMNS